MKKALIIVVILLLGVIGYMYFTNRVGEYETSPEPLEDTSPLVPAEDQKPVALYDSFGDKEIKEENEFLIVNIVYPFFDNKKLSDEVEDIVEGELRQFKKDINFDNFPIEEKNRIKEFGYKYTFDGSYEINEGEGLHSIVLDFSTYTGGAHGNHYIRSINYNDAGQRITIGDVFQPETNYLSELSRISRVKLQEKLAENVSSWMEEGTAPITENFSTFYTDSEGMLHIIFQPYQVGPWATGVVDISIDMKSELGSIIDPKYLSE